MFEPSTVTTAVRSCGLARRLCARAPRQPRMTTVARTRNARAFRVLMATPVRNLHRGERGRKEDLMLSVLCVLSGGELSGNRLPVLHEILRRSPRERLRRQRRIPRTARPHDRRAEDTKVRHLM